MTRESTSKPGSVPPWYRRRRYVVAVALVVVAIALRVALPSILRWQIEKQASAAIAGQLTVGDVDLWILAGGVALKDVALRAESAAADTPPVVAFQRLYVQVGWLPLFRRTVRIEDVALDGPAVHLERLASGEVPIPGLRAPASAPAATKPGTPWNVVVDRAALHAGSLSVLDRVPTPPENTELALDDIAFDDFTLLHTDDGAPGHGSIAAKFGDGTLRIDATVTTRPEGYAFEATVDAANVPLDRMHEHAPRLGWSGFTGRLDAHLTIRAEPNELPVGSGTMALRDLRVDVPGESEPALAWRKLAFDVDEFSIARRHAAVKSVVLDGGAVVVTPKGVRPVPLLRGRAEERVASAPPDEGTEKAERAAQAEPAAPPSAESARAAAAESAHPWTWKVGTVQITDTKGTVVLEPPPLVVEIAKGTVTELDSAQGSRAKIDLQIKEDQGTVVLTGTVGLDPLAADLAAKIEGLALGRLLAATGPAPVQLPSGTVAGDLTIQADRGPLVVRGTLAIADLGVKLPKGEDFGVAWKRLELGIKEVRVPGVLPGTKPATPEPIGVDVERLKLVAPVVTLTRAVSGIVLPGGGEPAATTVTSAPAATSPTSPPTAAVAARTETPPPAAGASPVTVKVGRLGIEGGQLTFVDQTVKPVYRGKLSALTVDAHGLRFPENAFDDVTLAVTLPGGAPLKVDAKQAKGAITVTANGKALPLQQFNPYVTQAAGYSISDGRLSVSSKVQWASGKYNSTTTLEFDKLGVAGAEGDSLFLQKVGIPLTVALSLLRDLNGKISLAVPVTGDRSGTHVDLGTIVAQALVKAIIGAVTSPLKMLGAVGGLIGGGGGGTLTPEPIPCSAGSAAVDVAASERVQQLGSALAAAPALRITLHGTAGGPDVRALQEAAVLADLQAKQGVLRGVRNLANRGERNAIRDYLVTRAGGGTAELSPDNQKTLDEWAAAKTISDDQLRTLAASRAEGLKDALTTGQHVDPSRVAAGDPEVDREKGKPAVRIAFGA